MAETNIEITIDMAETNIEITKRDLHLDKYQIEVMISYNNGEKVVKINLTKQDFEYLKTKINNFILP